VARVVQPVSNPHLRIRRQTRIGDHGPSETKQHGRSPKAWSLLLIHDNEADADAADAATLKALGGGKSSEHSISIRR
jgi:hypothetical protein